MAGVKWGHSVLVPNVGDRQSVSRFNLPTVTPTAPLVPHFPTQMGCSRRKSRLQAVRGGLESLFTFIFFFKGKPDVMQETMMRTLIVLQICLQGFHSYIFSFPLY